MAPSLGSAVTLVDGVATSISTRATLPAGIHTITGVYSGDAIYTGFTQTIPQTITQAPLTITADDKSKVYGAADPTLTFSVTGLVNGDDPSVITGVTLATTTGAAATAGTHTITATGGTAANYAITDVNGTLTVSQATLTVTADNKTKVYGAADPILTYTPSGTLYYGDAYSVITGVTLATATGAAATAGTHAITATGGTAANYAITDVNGTLTVTPLPLVTVTSVQIETVHLKQKRKKKIATDIVVTFSGAVDTLDAGNLGTYSLAAPGKGKKSKTLQQAHQTQFRRVRRDGASGDASVERQAGAGPSAAIAHHGFGHRRLHGPPSRRQRQRPVGRRLPGIADQRRSPAPGPEASRDAERWRLARRFFRATLFERSDPAGSNFPAN